MLTPQYPWPTGYFPLSLRGGARFANSPRPKEYAWAPKGVPLYVSRADGTEPSVLDFVTQEPLPFVDDERRSVTLPMPANGSIRLLAPPGTYILEFEMREELIRIEHTVEDPLAGVYSVPYRDGRPLWRRPGRWDTYIIKEKPYDAMPIGAGEVVFDCGAHIGTYARWAVAQGADRVVCYEPDAVNYALLLRNTADLPQVETRHACISNATGTARLYLNVVGEGGGNALHSIERTTSNDMKPYVDVPCLDLFAEMEQHRPTVVKLDIEGTERILDYARLPGCVRHICLEVDNDDVGKAACQRIVDAGFTWQIEPRWVGWNVVAFLERK